jgi:hypothetical protein
MDGRPEAQGAAPQVSIAAVCLGLRELQGMVTGHANEHQRCQQRRRTTPAARPSAMTRVPPPSASNMILRGACVRACLPFGGLGMVQH